MTIKLSRALCATTALATGLLISGAALAQSTTGSATVEELVVTGSTGPRSLDGIVTQTAPKTRTVIDQEFIARQMPGQSVADSLNVVPGYNFTNNDPYGNSGGNIRLRSFDCARVSFQWDGMQLNDSGNYACFTNQLGDSEIISVADVAQGTTDVDAPSASATGGSINYRTKVPPNDFGGEFNIGAGSFDYYRGYGEIDTGEVGPWGTKAFGAISYTKYDKFNGPGDLEKLQYNARVYQPLRDNGDFASLSFHWNRNRNNFYRQLTLAQFQQFGYKFENDISCLRPTPVGGTAQNDTTQSTVVQFNGVTLNNTSCTNYANVRINPSNTGNIRGQFKYHVADSVIFTFDPTFQYVLANGGGFTVVSETDNRLRGTGIVTNAANTATGGAGRDLNGDGDTLDSVQLYTPNNTNTRRYGINSSLIWDINEDHRVRLAYAFDRAKHRQTAENTRVDLMGNPDSPFAGKDGHADKVATADNSFLRGRDRYSVALLNMGAAEYLGYFLERKVEVRAGVRVPYFKRELNQFCYSQNGTSTVLCTTAPTLTTVGGTTLTNGNVFIAGQGTTQYIRPYQKTLKYDKVLPNIGISYKFEGGHSVYGSYAKAFGAPRTDNLYTVIRLADGSIGTPDVNGESSRTFDVGYRYTSSNLLISIAAYDSKFSDRIVSSFDPDTGIFTDRNIGSVKIRGGDAQAVFQPAEYLTYIGNISYNKAKVEDNIPLSGGNVLPTKGKRLVETPKWQWFQRLEWEITDSLSFGVQAKWVGERYTTDVNDQKVRAYSLVDADLRWKLPEVMGNDGFYIQANVKNLFDEKYIGSISSTTNSIALTGSSASQPFLTRGSTRAFQVSLHGEF
jgi:iron complex outermembrane receptor protein